MEAVNGVSDADKGIPTAPSPLTGCYLLIVVGEPHSQEHKDIILQRIAKGLLSWDASDCYVDLEKELAIITEQAPEGEDARYGERLIQFASENLVTEILIHPAISTLSQCMKNLLSSFTRHRHIIHSGYTYAANGSWILQDGTFSLADFSEAFQEIEVQRILRAYDNSISLDIHCSPEGDWTRLPKESFTKNCKVRVNPDDVLSSGSSSIVSFLSYISPFVIPTDIETLLESSDVVGNIRFSHPTLYVFPGGQGDAALFGINGFNMLVDGGFARKSCFWDFVRHLDRLDAVLLTRLNNSNINGISSILRRKKFNTVYPQIGHFFCNIQERKSLLSPDGDKDKDPLLINLLEEGQELFNNLRQLNLQPQPCYRDIEPINLYHKVGHGTLDMYVISPARDSKEVKEFLQKWNSNDQKLFSNQRVGKDLTFPIQNLISICALLVWQPANANHNITRILFPGSTPQHKIFEGLDKLKQLECMKYPSCTAKSIAPAAIKSKYQKSEKLLQDHKEFKIRDKLIQNDSKNKIENKTSEEIIKNGHTNGNSTDHIIPTRTIRKHDSTESEKSGPKSMENRKTDDKKDVVDKVAEEKAKSRAKVDQKLKADPKALKKSRSIERKPKPAIDKKPSPTTPKKTIDAKLNGEAYKFRAKTSPSSTPAKSTKEANNRKVVESKYKVAAKRDISKPEKKEVKDRKPVSRKAAESSPSRKVFESPIRKPSELHKVESRKAKFEKEGTTDSSTVSTPSAADADVSMKKELSKLTPEELEQFKARELAELKEEQEVVNEIEAVFRKSETKKLIDSDLRKIKSVSVDDKTEGEEYLIIEKEVIEQDSLDEKDIKDGENQKHLRDSEESEKQRKLSNDAPIEKLQLGEKSDENVVQLTDKTPPTADIANVAQSKEFSKDVSATSPEEKFDGSGGKKICDRDMDEENRENNILESQPDEKYSTPIESGATTAPTLPEDERIPLDEIKEDNADQVIVEKYVKEDTKEKEIPTVQVPSASNDCKGKLPHIVGIRLDKQTPIRDIVKTPDEVADLPMHEVVDSDNYEHFQASTDTNKQDENKHLNISKAIIRPKEISNGLSEKVPQDENEIVDEKEEIDVTKEVPIVKEDIKPEVQEELETEKKEVVTETLEENLIPTSVEESEKDNDNEKDIVDKEKINDLNLNEESNLLKDAQVKESGEKTIPVDTEHQKQDIEEESKLTIELSQTTHTEVKVVENTTTERDGDKEVIRSTVETAKLGHEKDEISRSMFESFIETPVETVLETKETTVKTLLDDKDIKTILHEEPKEYTKADVASFEPAREIDSKEEKEDTQKQLIENDIKREEPTDKADDQKQHLVTELIAETSTEIKTETTAEVRTEQIFEKVVEPTLEDIATEDVIESKVTTQTIVHEEEEKTSEQILDKVSGILENDVVQQTIKEDKIKQEEVEVIESKIEETTKKEIHHEVTEVIVDSSEDIICKNDKAGILSKVEDLNSNESVISDLSDKEIKLTSDVALASKTVPEDIAKTSLKTDKEPQLIEKSQEILLESTKETKDSIVEISKIESHTEKITTEKIESDSKIHPKEIVERVEDISDKLTSATTEEMKPKTPTIEIDRVDTKESEDSTGSQIEIEKESKTEVESEIPVSKIEKESKENEKGIVEDKSKDYTESKDSESFHKPPTETLEPTIEKELKENEKGTVEDKLKDYTETKDSESSHKPTTETTIEKELKENEKGTVEDKSKDYTETKDSDSSHKPTTETLEKTSMHSEKFVIKTDVKTLDQEIVESIIQTNVIEESLKIVKDEVEEENVSKTVVGKLDTEKMLVDLEDKIEETKVDGDHTPAVAKQIEEKCMGVSSEHKESELSKEKLKDSEIVDITGSDRKDSIEPKIESSKADLDNLQKESVKVSTESIVMTTTEIVDESDSKDKVQPKTQSTKADLESVKVSTASMVITTTDIVEESDSKDKTHPKIQGTKADLENFEIESTTPNTELIDIKEKEIEIKASEVTTSVVKVTEVISHEIASELNAISEIDEIENILGGAATDSLDKIETLKDKDKIETKEIDSPKINDNLHDIHVEEGKLEILIPKEIKSDKRESIHEEVEIIKPAAALNGHKETSETTQSNLEQETSIGLTQLKDSKDVHEIVISEQSQDISDTISAIKTSSGIEKTEVLIDEQMINKIDKKLEEIERIEKVKVSSDGPLEDLQKQTSSSKDEKETCKPAEKLIQEIVKETELNLNRFSKELDKTDKIDLQKEDILSKNELGEKVIEIDQKIKEDSSDKYLIKEDVIQKKQGDIDNKIEKHFESELETVLDKSIAKAIESDKHEIVMLSDQLEEDLELPKGEFNVQERSDSVCTIKSVEDETVFKSDNINKSEIDFLDKMELGRKSPKEREQDVAIIVASVAEVLKSDAPLEEFEGKIPLEVTSFSSYPLRETHITTLDSPICDKDIPSTFKSYSVSDPVSTFLTEERKVAPIHTDYDAAKSQESKVSSLIKDSTELIEATSKMISGIKQTSNGSDFHAAEKIIEPSLSAIIEKPLEETIVSKQDSAIDISQVIEPVHVKDEHKTKENVHDIVLPDVKLHDSTSERSKKDLEIIEDSLLKDDLNSSIIISKTQDTIDLSKELIIDLEKDVESKEDILNSAIKSVTSSRKSSPEQIIKDTLDVNGSSLSGKSTPEIKDTTPSSKSPIPSRASTPSIVINEDTSDIDGKLIEPYIESEIEIAKDLKCTEDSRKISKDEEEINLDKVELNVKEKEDTSSTPKDLVVKENVIENVFDITKSFIDSEKSSHCDKIKDDLQIAQKSIELGEGIEINLKDKPVDLKHEISSKSIPQEIEIHRSSISGVTEIEKSDKLKDFTTEKTTPSAVQTTPIVKTPPQILDDHNVSDKKESKEILNIKTTEIRSSTPTSDDCDISSGQVSRVHTTEDDDEKELSDEEDLPGSPSSAVSQVAHSTSSQYDNEDSVKCVAPIDPMSTSFYGALPDDSLELSKDKKTSDLLEDTDLDFNKAMIEHRQTRGEDLVPSGSPSHVYEITTAKYSSGKLKDFPESSKSETATAQPENLMTASFIGSELPSNSKDDPIASWGKPLGLPSPAPLNDNKGTPKKERKIVSNVMAKNKLNEDKKNADSKYDKKGKKIIPVYMDLTYVPHHGNSNYSYVDFFKKVRARYYVFSGIEPSKEVYNALLEAKQTWDDKELEVTIISTYDTDVLGYWVAENEDLLTKCKIDLSPSASRCTINLQDHETSCSAYRLEFS